jgi:hypothetical protein
MSTPSSFVKKMTGLVHPGHIASRAVDRMTARGVIASGPFRGFPASTDATEDGLWNYLLGLYEHCLHEEIEILLARDFPLILDVGGGTGYYAVGLALRKPSTKTITFEGETTSRDRLRAYMEKAQTKNLEIRGFCAPVDLLPLIESQRGGFLLMDCEGGERELLGEPFCPALATWHILVELHDWQAPEAAEEIRTRFQGSHAIRELWTRDLQASDFNFLLPWPLSYYCLPALRRMCDERRGGPMRFFVMTPKGTRAA